MALLQAMLLAGSLSGPTTDPAARLDELLAAGERSSPVRAVLYVSLEREVGRDLVSSLFREVEAGRLKGRVRLALRPLPDEEGVVAPAAVAAARQGMLWPYLRMLRPDARPLHEPTLRRAADRAGLDADGFDLALRDRETEVLLEALRHDGTCQGATAPCVLVGGRRLHSGVTCDELVAALLAEHARAADERSSR